MEEISVLENSVKVESMEEKDDSDSGRVVTFAVVYPEDVKMLIKITRGRGRPQYYILREGKNEAERIIVTLTSVTKNAELPLIRRLDSELNVLFRRKLLVTEGGLLLMYYEKH